MSELVPFDQNTLPAEVAGFFEVGEMADDLSAGVAGGFAILSFRGSKWRIKSGGEETLITDANEEAKPSVELIFLRASSDVSKVYYDHKFVEGSDDPPTCMSVNGILPDADVAKPQAASCAACEYSQWGSRMTDDGRKAKACQDSRRVAVVPMGDIENEQYGGPMLLRVPAASLNDLKTYGLGMKNKGFPYNTIITRVGFDPDASYPKLTFKPIRRITQEEAVEMAEHYKAERIDVILTQADEARAVQKQALVATDKPAPQQEAVSLDFEETPQEAEPVVKAEASKKAATKKKAEPKAQPAEKPPEESSELSGELDDILSKLENA